MLRRSHRILERESNTGCSFAPPESIESKAVQNAQQKRHCPSPEGFPASENLPDAPQKRRCFMPTLVDFSGTEYDNDATLVMASPFPEAMDGSDDDEGTLVMASPFPEAMDGSDDDEGTLVMASPENLVEINDLSPSTPSTPSTHSQDPEDAITTQQRSTMEVLREVLLSIPMTERRAYVNHLMKDLTDTGYLPPTEPYAICKDSIVCLCCRASSNTPVANPNPESASVVEKAARIAVSTVTPTASNAVSTVTPTASIAVTPTASIAVTPTASNAVSTVTPTASNAVTPRASIAVSAVTPTASNAVSAVTPRASNAVSAVTPRASIAVSAVTPRASIAVTPREKAIQLREEVIREFRKLCETTGGLNDPEFSVNYLFGQAQVLPNFEIR